MACMSISARALAITGIDDSRYWNWVPTEESRFHEVAYLQHIWWLEVDWVVKFPFLLISIRYPLDFVLVEFPRGWDEDSAISSILMVGTLHQSCLNYPLQIVSKYHPNAVWMRRNRTN